MKKNIPLNVIQNIHQVVDESKDFIKLINDDSCILHFKDKDKKSNFYFKIKSYSVGNDGKAIYRIDFNPSTPNHNNPVAFDTYIDQVIENFKKWIKLIDDYNKIELPKADDDLEFLENEIENEFEIIDADKDSAKYDIRTQFKLIEYLDFVIEKTEEIKTEENSEKIDEIITDTKTLQSFLPKLTKQEVFDKLKSIWAKCWAVSVKLVREVVIKATADLIVRAMKGEFVEIPPIL